MAPLIGRMAASSMALLLITAVILAAKFTLKRHLSLNMQYWLWFPFLLALFIPFLPIHFHGNAGLLAWISARAAADGSAAGGVTGAGGFGGMPRDWLKDFSVSVSRQAPERFYRLVFYIWAAGSCFMTTVTVRSCMRIHMVRRASLPLQDKHARALFDACRRELQIRRGIPVLSTAYLKSPVTAGIIRPCVLLPISAINELTAKELRFIFLHELTHLSRQDALVNHLACLARILYWFHPAVWFAVKELRKDEESACDGAVLARLDEKDYRSYGETLLKFAAALSGASCAPVAGIGGRREDLRKRIIRIRDFRLETRRDKAIGRTVFIMMTALMLGIAPSVSSRAEYRDSRYSPPENMVEADFSPYFHGYEGSFVLYDRNQDQFRIYHPSASLERVSPDSTYKICSALTALQAGVIAPGSTALQWDHAPNPFAAWNQDQTLSSAMQNSVNWYFNALDQNTGLDTIKRSLKTLRYGNGDLSGGIGRFWAESTLKISPVEQVELLNRLDMGDLPFDPQNIDAVKEALFLSESGGVSLYGKTGTGAVGGREIRGWFVGFAKSSFNTYVFAVHIQAEEGANGSTAAQIALDILDDMAVSQK